MTRINFDSDNKIQDHTEEKHKEDVKKADQDKFAQKLITQKNAEQSSRAFQKINVESRQKEAERTKLTPKTKSAEQMPKTLGKVPQKNDAPIQKTKQEKEKSDVKKDSTKDVKAEKKREQLLFDNAILRRDEKNQNEFSGGESDEFFQQSAAIGSQSAPKVDQTQNTTAGTSISPEVLHEIVDKILVGINQQGLTQFVIELKSGVLGGGQISVSSNGKRIALKFSGLDKNSQNLVRQAKGELRERLNQKNLSLESFEII